MNEGTKAFLRQAYKRYYFNHPSSVQFPKALETREFGYIPFGGNMIRHLSFRGAGEAIAEIVKQSPSSVYCSNARYSSPTLPIEEKGWLGAELIFDIDATDIATSCKRGHDVWYCESCHHSGRLPNPRKCPRCGGSASEFHGTCKTCLDAAKDHARRVAAFLTDDFGTSRDDIRIYFSGNRGYHLHVFDERFDSLTPEARGEVADYVRGGSLPASQSIASSLRRRQGRATADEGWMRRIESYVDESRPGYSGTLQKLVSEAIGSSRALVDASVTTDIHRVFRLAGTLHGNTGLSKKQVESLDAFDAAHDPLVLDSEPVRLSVGFCPRFSIGGESYGPFKSQDAQVPTYAAVLILTRGFGEVAG